MILCFAQNIVQLPRHGTQLFLTLKAAPALPNLTRSNGVSLVEVSSLTQNNTRARILLMSRDFYVLNTRFRYNQPTIQQILSHSFFVTGLLFRVP